MEFRIKADSLTPAESRTRGRRPVFFVGVTGLMKLDPGEITYVRGRVREFFLWLQQTDVPVPAGVPIRDSDHQHDGHHRATPKFLASDGIRRGGLGLGDSVILLSGMAPGVDQLVAEVARELGVRVEVPLPFPREHMDQASSYQGSATPPGWRGGSPWLDSGVLDGLPSYLVRIVGDNESRPTDGDFGAMRAGDSLKAERRRRYRAVGEFIAAHSDLLIAIDNQAVIDDPHERFSDVEKCGTDVIVQMKRRGPTRGLLPLLPAIDWSDNGPVFYLRVASFLDQCPIAATQTRPPWQVWHPYDALSLPDNSPAEQKAHARDASPESGKEQLNNRAWDRFENFVAAVVNIRRETSTNPAKAAATENKELRALLPRCEGVMYVTPRPNFSGPAPAPADIRWAKFSDFAAARAWIAGINREVDGDIKVFRTDFLRLAFTFWVAFQFAELWIVPNHHGHTFPIHNLIRWVAAVVAIGTLLQALYLLRRHQGRLWSWFENQSSDFARLEDYRAVAEGMRVQFYWSVVGLAQSAAAHYLQRAHSELNWIRSSISSLALPYETDRDVFLRLDPKYQRTLLRAVQTGWVDNQRQYFLKKVAELKRSSIESHFGATFLLAAGLTSLFWMLLMHLLHTPVVVHWIPGWIGLSMALLAIGFPGCVYALFGQRRRQRRTPGSSSIWPLNLRAPGLGVHQRRRRLFVEAIYEWAHEWWVPTILGVGFGAGGVAFFQSSPLGTAHVPHPDRLVQIFQTLCLVLSGLFHLSASWRFLTENIHRYSNMEVLFRHASIRLGTLLTQLEQCDANDRAAHANLVDEAQELLLTLGKEALNENTDWHILHRTHPMNPVTPG